MLVIHHHSSEDLRNLAKYEKKAKIRTKLYAIAMAQELKTAKDIAASFGYSKDSIERWVAAYNHLGLAGLQEFQNRGGREKTLNDEEEHRFRERLNQGSRKGDKECVLRGKAIQKILEVEFGKPRKLSTVYALLHRLGYRLLSPRPRHPKASQQQQEEFKKN